MVTGYVRVMLRMPSEFIVHTLENATSESKICLCSVVGHSQTPQKAKPKAQPVERDAWQPLSISISKLSFFKSFLLLMEEVLHQLRLAVYPIIGRVLYIPGA